jgi:hypothetical protein
MFSNPLSENQKIKSLLQKLRFFYCFYGCGALSLKFRGEHRLCCRKECCGKYLDSDGRIKRNLDNVSSAKSPNVTPQETPLK